MTHADHENTDDRQRELQLRARVLWPNDEYLQREWIRASLLRDEVLGITTRYLGIDHHEESHHAPSLR